MNREEPRPDPTPIQPRTDTPQQDPLVNPGYQPVQQDLPAEESTRQPPPRTSPDK